MRLRKIQFQRGRSSESMLPSSDTPQRIRSEIDNLVKIATEPKLSKLPVEEQRMLLQAFDSAADRTKFADALKSLLRSPNFDILVPDAKTAVVNQIKNYPDDRSVRNIERMLAKDWLRGQALEDKQRSLKTIAYLSQHDKGSREVIDNTLDRLLAPGSDLKLRWADLEDADGWGTDENTITYGEGDAKTRVLT